MVRERNRNKILQLLSDAPKRFTELEKESQLSPRGLTGILKDLLKDKQIKKTLHNDKQAYEITKKGAKLFTDIVVMQHMLDMLEEKNAKSYGDYSTVRPSSWFCRVPWGISDNLILENSIGEKYNPITKEVATLLNEEIYKQVKKQIIKNKTPVNKNIKGNILLYFTINYKELIESIEENALEYQQKISKRELDLLEKIEHGEISDEIIKELYELRKKTSGGKTKL